MKNKSVSKGKDKLDMVSKKIWNKKRSQAQEEAERDRKTTEAEDRRKAGDRGVLASGCPRNAEARATEGIQDEYSTRPDGYDASTLSLDQSHPPWLYGYDASTLSLDQSHSPRPYGFDASMLNLNRVYIENLAQNHTPSQQHGPYFSTPDVGSGFPMYGQYLLRPQFVPAQSIPFGHQNLATSRTPSSTHSADPSQARVSSPGYNPTPSPSMVAHQQEDPHPGTVSQEIPSLGQLVNVDTGAPSFGDVLTDYDTHYARVLWRDP